MRIEELKNLKIEETIMKKVYEIPEIAVTLMETNEILAGSYGPWSDGTTVDDKGSILSREDDTLFFEDED